MDHVVFADVSEQVFLTQAVLLMNPDNATAWNLRLVLGS